MNYRYGDDMLPRYENIAQVKTCDMSENRGERRLAVFLREQVQLLLNGSDVNDDGVEAFAL